MKRFIIPANKDEVNTRTLITVREISEMKKERTTTAYTPKKTSKRFQA